MPNSGSFVRPSASIILGSSFLQALSSKYVEIPFETSNERVVLGSSNGTIEVEAVGMNKVRSKLSRLESLREVSLDKENVARADKPGQILRRCPSAYRYSLLGSVCVIGVAFRYQRFRSLAEPLTHLGGTGADY